MKRALLSMTLLGTMLWGCGQGTDSVFALNLTTGEEKQFSSEDEVPTGWALCSGDDCTKVSPDVPCQNLGEATCTLNPNCRLKTLGCSGVACSGSPDGTSTEPCQPEPPECDYACIPKLPLLCEELTDEKDCGARTDCEWGPAPCPAIACEPGTPCPPCDGGVCMTKSPPSCEELDELSCGKRADCHWNPEPCPLACPAGVPDCGTLCKPFCQPLPLPKPCPDLAPPTPGFCPDGKIVAKYDDKGCVVGFDCVEVCPDITMVYPDCPDGTVVPKYDEKGCLIGYVCENTPPTKCNDLATAYQQALVEARRCNSMVATPLAQCSLTVDDALGCGCPTYVNPANTAAVSLLLDLKGQWQANNCQLGLACPAMPCFVPNGATCAGVTSGGGGTPGGAPDSSSGTCVDNPS